MWQAFSNFHLLLYLLIFEFVLTEFGITLIELIKKLCTKDGGGGGGGVPPGFGVAIIASLKLILP